MQEENKVVQKDLQGPSYNVLRFAPQDVMNSNNIDDGAFLNDLDLIPPNFGPQEDHSESSIDCTQNNY